MTQSEKQRLAQLGAVTETGLNASLLQLKKASDRTRDVQTRIEDLEAARRAILYDPTPPATIAGADQRWLAWAEQERARLNAALARARVAEARQRSAATTAFGRNDAMRKLIARKALR